MNPIPINLPVRLSEAAALVDAIVECRGGQEVDAGVRTRLGERLGSAGLSSLAVYPGSLEADPEQPGWSMPNLWRTNWAS